MAPPSSIEKSKIGTRDDRLTKHRPALDLTVGAREEGRGRFPFPGRGTSREEETEGPLDPRLVRFRLGNNPPGNGPTGGDDERVIGEKQRL